MLFAAKGISPKASPSMPVCAWVRMCVRGCICACAHVCVHVCPFVSMCVSCTHVYLLEASRIPTAHCACVPPRFMHCHGTSSCMTSS